MVRATGVAYRTEHGTSEKVAAGTEVVVCAGAIGSPHLLLLSGVGPGEELTAVGVARVVDLPGVGRHLKDHLHTPLMFALHVGGANRDARCEGQVVDGGLLDESSVVDDDDVVGEQCDLRQHMAGDQHRAPAGGEGLQKGAQPADARRVEPVRRLAQDQQVRVTEERGGQAEPLPHPQGEPADLAVRVGGQLNDVENLVDPVRRDAGGGGEHPQVVASRTQWVEPGPVDQHTGV